MSWFYAEGSVQKGPVEDEEFQQLVQSGAIRADTLVWREGMSDWAPYGSVAASGTSSPPADASPSSSQAAPATGSPGSSASSVICDECRQAVPPDETVVISGRTICARCKPQVVQRMVEGADAALGGFDPDVALAGLRQRGGYRLPIRNIVERAMRLVFANFWPCVGVTLLMYLILGAAQNVPCIGLFATLFVTGPVMGGLLLYFLLQVRGEKATINEAFSGFRQPLLTQLALASLVAQGITFGIVLIVMLPIFLLMPALETNAERLWPLFVVVGVLVFAAILYVTMIWTPAYVIIADKRVRFWPGLEFSRKMVQMQWLSWLGLLLMLFLVGLLGMVLLCVGVFIAMPIGAAAIAIAWNDVLRQIEGTADVSNEATLRPLS